jgi:hypothetical protein
MVRGWTVRARDDFNNLTPGIPHPCQSQNVKEDVG